MTEKPTAIVVLISGSGSNLQAIIDAVVQGDINGQISAVISDVPDAYGLTRAKQADIPAIAVTPKDYADKAAFNRALSDTVAHYQPDLIVLAGFMRILDSAFVKQYHGHMINIHPSLLPKYRGLDTYRRALEAGDQQHGVTVHFVSDELDGGPMIAQTAFPVEPGDTEESLQQRGQAQEHILYPNVIRWFCDGRLQLADDGHVYLDGERVPC